MATSTKFSIGCDPEFFLFDNKICDFVSAHDVVPGDKKNPYKLPDGSHVQADGLAVEFNTPPAYSGKEFSECVKSALNELRKFIPRRYMFHFVPIVYFKKEYFDKLPEPVKELGCDPDYTASLTEVLRNKVPDSIGSNRTGSGHIHLGWVDKADTTPGSAHFFDAAAMAILLDAAVEETRMHWDYYRDRREQYYGARGAFRCKPYGTELRTPSNCWLSYPNFYKILGDIVLETADKGQNGSFKKPLFSTGCFHPGRGAM